MCRNARRPIGFACEINVRVQVMEAGGA